MKRLVVVVGGAALVFAWSVQPVLSQDNMGVTTDSLSKSAKTSGDAISNTGKTGEATLPQSMDLGTGMLNLQIDSSKTMMSKQGEDSLMQGGSDKKGVPDTTKQSWKMHHKGSKSGTGKSSKKSPEGTGTQGSGSMDPGTGVEQQKQDSSSQWSH